jgi:hypothetical protein
MPAHLLRVVLTAFVILGLLVPRISAVVASAAPGGMTVVICTGSGLQTIRIDEDGTPVQVGHQVDHCVLSHTADTAVRVEPAPTVAPVAWNVERPGDQVRASGYQAARPPPRAPPLAA